jgi:aldose 1-epimerase
VDLTLNSKDGDQRFPGNLTVRVRYTVWPCALRIEYLFTTDQTTIVNRTNHSSFNLSGHPGRRILGDDLAHAADRYTPIDARLIPLESLRIVEGTPFDFRSKTVIGSWIDREDTQLELPGGYDHNIVLTGSSGELREVAYLHIPDSGRILTISTMEPRPGKFFDNTKYGAAREGHRRHTELCLETEHFPYSPNHTILPSSELRPGRSGCSITNFEPSVHTS